MNQTLQDVVKEKNELAQSVDRQLEEKGAAADTEKSELVECTTPFKHSTQLLWC